MSAIDRRIKVTRHWCDRFRRTIEEKRSKPNRGKLEDIVLDGMESQYEDLLHELSVARAVRSLYVAAHNRRWRWLS